MSRTNVAVDDLKPDSKCLKEINAGDRNGEIEYSIILGDLGILTTSQTSLLKQFAKLLDDEEVHDKEVNDEDEGLKSLLKALPPELITGQGDGVVSVESGKLSGVKDTVVMRFQHRELLKDDGKSQAKIIRQILRRLKPSEKVKPLKLP